MVPQSSTLWKRLLVEWKCMRTGAASISGCRWKRARSPYLIASRTRGNSDWKMLYRHLAGPKTNPPLT